MNIPTPKTDISGDVNTTMEPTDNSNQSQQQPQPVSRWSNLILGHLRLAFLAFGVIALTIYGRCGGKHGEQVPATQEEIKGPVNVLPRLPEKKAHEPKRVDKPSEETPYVPPEGRTIIEPKDPNENLNDLIKVRRQEFGIFPGEFGLQTSFVQPSIGLDAKIIFYRRFGLNLGVLGGSQLPFLISPTATISYRLDRIRWLHNTEIWAGYVPLARVPYQAGLRINL